MRLGPVVLLGLFRAHAGEPGQEVGLGRGHGGGERRWGGLDEEESLKYTICPVQFFERLRHFESH